MTTVLQRRESGSAWERFCSWITSTDNRLYIASRSSTTDSIGVPREKATSSSTAANTPLTTGLIDEG
ncbi:MAG: hypothetical protein AAF329_28330, partial [Cyanobacteria bacterium P01_A01_bin.17]